MSPHIASRWYRAPETILLEKDYEFGVDIWAIGCTFAELAVCSKPYLKYITKKSEKYGSDLVELVEEQVKNRFPFPGDSCYPMSPIAKNQEVSIWSNSLKAIISPSD